MSKADFDRTEQPLDSAEFAGLMAALGPLPAAPRLAAAVSGGPDSMALALLLHEWALVRGGSVTALTVDHGLRAESAAEAAQVGAWLAARGIAHHILRWADPKPHSAIQAQARQARYDLMGRWCRGQGIGYLAVGHQLQDQAETFLLRLRHGSGLDGLAAMAPRRSTVDVDLLRPLLTVPRQRLLATLALRGQDYVDDPSNQNPHYERVRMRRMMVGLDISPWSVADAAQILGQARHAMTALVDRAEALLVSHHPMGFAVVDWLGMQAIPVEIGMRLLTRLVQRVGGRAYPPRSDRLELLYCKGNGTLGGCRAIAKAVGVVVLCRENRGLEGQRPVLPGQTVVWDGRFTVSLSADCPAAVTVGALGADGWQQIRPYLSAQVPNAFRFTLPAIRHQEKVRYVPHLGYKSDDNACIFWDCDYFLIEGLGSTRISLA